MQLLDHPIPYRIDSSKGPGDSALTEQSPSAGFCLTLRCPQSLQPHFKHHIRESFYHIKRSHFLSLTHRRPIIPKQFSANQPRTIRLFPLSNYTFGTKENQPEEDPSVLARLKRLEEHYEQHGMRRTCEGILVCHEHNHPHILMLQIANAFFKL